MLPAYVIHAKSLPERTAHIQRELDAAGIKFEWVLDFDADEITPEVDQAYFAERADLTMRQKSCALKHIVAMQRIRERGHDLALVFEDDAQLVPDFCAQLQRVLEEAQRWPRPRILHLGAATEVRPVVGPRVEDQHGGDDDEGEAQRDPESTLAHEVELSTRLEELHV